MGKLIVANWKMAPGTEKEALKLAKASDGKNVVVCPPFVFLEAVGKNLKKAALGAQDIPVSPLMLKNLGVKYAILGHSDRRIKMGETDEMINKKVRAALAVGLKVILCVGENLVVRKKGIAAAKNFIKKQLQKDLKNLTNSKKLITNNLIVAYEPVWAISTNKNAKNDTLADAAEMISFIKQFSISNFQFSVKVLYGGSVDGKNIGGFLKYKEIDGFLVGGASLRSREFSKIISKVE